MKNFILSAIFGIGVILPALAIILLSPAPQSNADAMRQGGFMDVVPDEFDPGQPVISYDFSRGHIPSAQFVALSRETYSDGAVSIHITLPYVIHPDFWVDVFRQLPVIPDWLPIMMVPDVDQHYFPIRSIM